MGVTRDLRVVCVAMLAVASAVAVCAAPDEAKPQAARTRNEAQAPEPPSEERPELTPMRQWFADLDDSDATVRELARMKLMGMQRRDLPAFQKLVQDSRPLAPAQAAVLRQLVIHVYLAGEEYDTTGTQGFLGVRMQPTNVRLPAAEGSDPAAQEAARQQASAVGVIIVERMPGFVGARMLLDGDVILGLAEKQNAQMIDVFDFASAIQSIAPGTTVHFQVLRQGQVVHVPVTLDPKPFASDQALKDLIAQRQEKAEDYWNRSFARLVKESIG